MNCKNFILVFVALAAGLVSCQKATDLKESAEVAAGRLDVTGRVSGGVTKTVFTCEAHVLTPEWKVGDRIIGLWGTDKSVTWKVRKIADGVAKFGFVSGEEPGDGESVNVMYAPGKNATDVSGTGEERTLAYDLSSQSGLLKDLGKMSLMTGSGTVSGETLELTFAHAIAVVSIDTIKGLTPDAGGYSVSISGEGLANGGTFGISGGTISFTNGVDGKISTGSTFTANGDGEIGPLFFAVPAAVLPTFKVKVEKGNDLFVGTLFDREVESGNYYYRSSLTVAGQLAFAVNAGGKKVKFAPGNLWSDGNGKFYFENEQWEYGAVGDTARDDSHISHFFFTSNEEVSCALRYSDPEPTTEDVIITNKDNFVVDGYSAGEWKCLSKDEWAFLLNRQVNGGSGPGYSYQYVYSGSGRPGLLLYPDNYTAKRYQKEEVLTDYPAGCVFLPGIGNRDGKSLEYPQKLRQIGLVAYASGTPDPEDVMKEFVMAAEPAGAQVQSVFRRYAGPVRLVTVVSE